MLGNHPSIAITQTSEYAKEMRKHEALPTVYGPPGRPYTAKQEFPKRIYKAARRDVGSGIDFEGLTVNNEDEQRNMQSRGFSLTQQDALDALNRENVEHGTLAAERNFEIKHGRISEKAATEVRAAEGDYSGHLPEVPRTPVRRRGPNKPKAVPSA